MVGSWTLLTSHGLFQEPLKKSTWLYAPPLMNKFVLVMRHRHTQARDAIMRNADFCSTDFVHALHAQDNSALQPFQLPTAHAL